MRHFASLKSSLFLAALAASLSLPLSAAAEKGAELYSHEHRESHTSTRTESSTRTSTSTTSTHSSSSVSLDKDGSAEILGSILVPNPHRKVPQLDRVSRPASLTPVFAGRNQQGRWGLWDSQGRQLLAPRFKKLEAGANGSIIAWEGKDAPRYLTRTGQPAQAPISLESLQAFKEKGRWGFQDTSGKTVLTPVYQSVLTGFNEGIAFVKNSKGRTVAIDTQGKELFAAPYDQIFPFQDGLAETRRKVRSFNWASAVGAALGSALWDTSVYDPAAPLSLTWDGVKRGYIDRSGQVIIDDRNDAVFPMTPWGTFVKDKGELWFANRQGKILFGPGKYDISGGGLDEAEGLGAIQDKASGKYGVVDLSDGTLRLPFAWDGIQFLGGQRMLVKEGSSTRLVSETSGQVLRTWQYPVTVIPFGAGAEVTWLQEGKAFRLMDREGSLLPARIPTEVTQAGSFQGKTAPVKGKQGWGLMDAQGNWLVQELKEIKVL